MSLYGMDLSCKELVELVTDYLEGALTAHDRALFEAHLELCEPCVVYVRQIEDTVRLAGATRDDLEHAPAVHALLELFSDWRRRSPEPAS
jgi:anti-sigma factor RsiW